MRVSSEGYWYTVNGQEHGPFSVQAVRGFNEKLVAQAERELIAILRKDFGLTPRREREMESQAMKHAIEKAKPPPEAR
jgi:hypothetical protein